MHKSDARLPDSAEMRAIDQASIQSGIPSIELMRRAGREVYLKIIENLGSNSALAEILILCGPGNNGGDGLAIAAEFIKDGVLPKVIVAAADKYSPDFLLQFLELQQNCEVFFYPTEKKMPQGKPLSLEQLTDSIKNAHVIIDALLGTAQQSAPRKPIDEILKLVSHNTSAMKFSVDTPTGASPDSGELLSPNCFKAKTTIAVEQIKCGMLQVPLREYCGQIKTVKIGMGAVSDTKIKMALPLAKLPAQRSFNFHKGSAARVLVVAGSGHYPGAAVLCATAALKSGAGRVIKISPETNINTIQSAELINISLPGSFFQPAHLKALFDRKSKNYINLQSDDVFLIGPGLAQSKETVKFLKEILRLTNPKVVDADALNLLADFSPAELKIIKLKNSVITPHPQEAARLLKLKVGEVQQNRYLSAQKLYKKYNCAVILKGAGSIIVNSDGIFVNTSGNPFMATAGSGDILAGMLAALISQGLSSDQAALSATVLHGLAGDLAALEAGGVFLAGEISNNYNQAVAELKRIQQPQNMKLWTDDLVNHALNWPPE